ncbi:hypothetical protein [Hydrogenophaga crocea]|uniref:Tyr recombinase domain-containing protein n=1 Tax=Hydrogenophaga crocea TaxID=2716225 RepID=A0A6G8IIX3_9BURK|nr:hypothetical protein [Hydrogenophaga crocea]QIM53167.1 hypothetical protein G9Q37_13910 [Hydrogenophaga crocea]
MTWEFLPHAEQAIARFSGLINEVLFRRNEATSTGSDLGLLAARLVCLDGLRPETLPLLQEFRCTPYRCGDATALEWPEGPVKRLERRFLHPMTLALWPRLSVVVGNRTTSSSTPPSQDPQDDSKRHDVIRLLPLGDLLLALASWLSKVGLYKTSRSQSILEQLSADQIAWWSVHLPGPLFAHCTLTLSFTALERSAWGRLLAKHALVHRPEEFEAVDDGILDTTTNEPGERTFQLLEQIDATQGIGYDLAELRSMLEILKEDHPSGIDGLTKRVWIEGLQRMPLARMGVNPVTVALAGWICHMCELGTVTKANPAVSTLRQYVSAVLLALGKAMAGRDEAPEDWQADQLLEVYRCVYRETTKGRRPQALAALHSMHEYLMEAFDIEPLPGLIDSVRSDLVGGSDASLAEKPSINPVSKVDSADGRIPARVMANVIWDHEVDCCVERCKQASDPRLGRIAAVMIAIARECAVRNQDLSRLVLANVSFLADSRGAYCSIEVVRHAARGRLKTELSQRRLTVRDSRSLKTIREWVDFRRLETQNSKAYLFGESNNDKSRYRSAATQAFLNRVVKLATGYRRSRMYDLRHTVVSTQVSQALMSSAWVDANPLEIIASEAGHASPLTTIRSYSHLYEQALRMNLDIALESVVNASSQEMANALATITMQGRSLKGNSLVQAAKRRDIGLPSLWRMHMEAATHALPIETAQDPFEWAPPAALSASQRAKPQTPVHLLADALARMQRGENLEAIARVIGLPIDRMSVLTDRLHSWAYTLYCRQFPRKTAHARTPIDLLQCLESMHIKAAGASADLWSPLSRHLEGSVNRASMQAIITYWENAARGVYLALSPPANPRPLIALLVSGGLARGHLRVVAQVPKHDHSAPFPSTTSTDGSLPEGLRKDKTIGSVIDVFRQEANFNPWIETVAHRGDRPKMYLRINPHPAKDRAASSADATATLRAWLLAIKARLLLDELEDA